MLAVIQINMLTEIHLSINKQENAVIKTNRQRGEVVIIISFIIL